MYKVIIRYIKDFILLLTSLYFGFISFVYYNIYFVIRAILFFLVIMKKKNKIEIMIWRDIK